MRRGWLVLPAVVGLLFPVGPARAAEDTDPVARLVQQLGSLEYSERETASRILDACGLPALGALRTACQSQDPEVQRRAGELVAQIEKRLQASRLLTPSRIRLTYQNTQVSDALADIQKKTGLVVTLADNEAAKLAGRRITLDTGETTLWEAFDQFCQAAGLSERPGVVMPPQADYYYGKRGGGRILIIDDGRIPAASKSELRLVLGDGKRVLPTCYAGSFRIQALPPGTQVAGSSRGENEALLALEVTPEAQISWQSVVALHVTGAVDQHGQKLCQPEMYVAGSDPFSNPYGGNIILWDASGYVDPNSGMPNVRQVPLRLVLGKLPAEVVRELSGTVSVQVHTPVEAILTVDNLTQAVGQTLDSSDGGMVKVTEVKIEEGLLQVRVSVTSPPADLGGAAGRILRINRGIRAANTVNPQTGPANLKLLDGKGQPIPFVRGTCEYEGNGITATQHYTLSYKPAETPSLVVSGRRPLVIDVPFTLRDVPLGR